MTNELYLSVAAHLANRVPNRQRYFDVAKRQWSWFKNVGFINEQGTINDGLTDSCENNQQPVYVVPVSPAPLCLYVQGKANLTQMVVQPRNRAECPG